MRLFKTKKTADFKLGAATERDKSLDKSSKQSNSLILNKFNLSVSKESSNKMSGNKINAVYKTGIRASEKKLKNKKTKRYSIGEKASAASKFSLKIGRNSLNDSNSNSSVELKSLKYKTKARPPNYCEYFVRKSSLSSKSKEKSKSKSKTREQSKAGTSQDRKKTKVYLSSSLVNQSRDSKIIKIQKSFQSPSLKSISISLRKSSKIHQNRNKNAKLNKYISLTKRTKNDNLKKTSMVKSNQILPKYEKPKIRSEHSIKSLSKIEKVTGSSFHSERVKVKNQPSTTKNQHKGKNTVENRLKNTIFRSLNDVNKVLKRRKMGEDRKSKSKQRRQSNSLHHHGNEIPMSDSNKTKATMAESPQVLFPMDPILMVEMYHKTLSQLEKEEIKEFQTLDHDFKIYFLGDIPKRKTVPEDMEIDDDKGNLIADKGSNIYYRYEIKDFIGKGSFGKVYKVYDHKEK